MCELFGLNSAVNVSINAKLKEFFTHSKDHPHGWGLALFYDKDAVSLEKEPVAAYKSRYLKERLRRDISISSMLAHIRYATVGVMDYSNTHPFVYRDISGRNWTLIHNGTIFDYAPLRKYTFTQEGNTDSERVLMYIVDRMNEAIREAGRKLTRQERFNVLDEIVSDMAKGNKLNLLIYDSSVMYVHTNFKDSLYYQKTGDTIFFSTRPLSLGKWEPVPFTQLLAFRKGVLKFSGRIHGNEYIENQGDIQMLYREFSNL